LVRVWRHERDSTEGCGEDRVTTAAANDALEGGPPLLASCLAGLGERATHVLVADPSYGATYDLEAAFRTVRAGRSWWPPRSTVSPTATTASTWTPGGGPASPRRSERLRELITSAGRDEGIEVTATSA
jgi:hypothetical protein